jgi:hypothetical protein
MRRQLAHPEDLNSDFDIAAAVGGEVSFTGDQTITQGAPS